MFDPSPVVLMAVVVLDAVFKDPHYRLHPVRLVGDLVSMGESLCRRLPLSPKSQGVVLVVGVESAVLFSVVVLQLLFSLIHLQWLVALFLGYSALAGGALWEEARLVGEAVSSGALEEARARLSFLVTRDTSRMGAPEILKAAIESLAENTSDGIVAPLLFFALGGAPLAFIYKAADTMDSMVGYLNPQYAQFGWAAARLDDLLNFIPARLTALLVVVAGWAVGMDHRGAWRSTKSFAKCTASPNSGYPESAFAGALEVQLGGGRCVYFGQAVTLPPIGDGRDTVTPRDLFAAVELSKATTLAALLVSLVLVVF